MAGCLERSNPKSHRALGLIHDVVQLVLKSCLLTQLGQFVIQHRGQVVAVGKLNPVHLPVGDQLATDRYVGNDSLEYPGCSRTSSGFCQLCAYRCLLDVLTKCQSI